MENPAQETLHETRKLYINDTETYLSVALFILDLNMYVLFNWRGWVRERYLDYIKLNYLFYSYKVLNPDTILYLHTSLNNLLLYNLNTFHIMTLHSQSSLLKSSHLCYYIANSVGLATRFCTSNESSTKLGEFWPCQIL